MNWKISEIFMTFKLFSTCNNEKFLLYPVAELKAIILGPADLYVKSGSEITLICKLQQGPHDLGTVFWYKGKL